MQSLLSTDVRVKKCPTTTSTNLQGSTNSLAIAGDRYNGTRTREAFASLIMSIQAYDSPSFWYALSSNTKVVYVNYCYSKSVYFILRW